MPAEPVPFGLQLRVGICLWKQAAEADEHPNIPSQTQGCVPCKGFKRFRCPSLTEVAQRRSDKRSKKCKRINEMAVLPSRERDPWPSALVVALPPTPFEPMKELPTRPEPNLDPMPNEETNYDEWKAWNKRHCMSSAAEFAFKYADLGEAGFRPLIGSDQRAEIDEWQESWTLVE